LYTVYITQKDAGYYENAPLGGYHYQPTVPNMGPLNHDKFFLGERRWHLRDQRR